MKNIIQLNEYFYIVDDDLDKDNYCLVDISSNNKHDYTVKKFKEFNYGVRNYSDSWEFEDGYVTSLGGKIRKITHSDQILEGVTYLPTIVFEEIIYGYSLEEITKIWYDTEKFKSSHIADIKSFMDGFNTHRQLIKTQPKNTEWMVNITTDGKIILM